MGDIKAYESKYKFEDLTSGFRVKYKGKEVCDVFSKDGLKISVKGNDKNYSTDFNPMNRHSIIECIAREAAQLNDNLKDHVAYTRKQRGKNHGILKWAQKKAGMAIAKKVVAKLNEIKINPDFLTICKRVFSVCGPKCFDRDRITKNFQLLTPYQIKDCITYNLPCYIIKDLDLEYYPETLDNWLNPLGKDTYKFLRKTLMNVPRSLRTGTACKFFLVKGNRYSEYANHNVLPTINEILVAPLEHRLQFLAMDEVNNQQHYKVVSEATRKELIRAIREVQLRDVKLDLRSTNNVINAFSYIFDFPEDHNGNIVGLARKSKEWHRTADFTRFTNSNGVKPDTKTKLPPIDLPKIDGVKFLSAANDLFEESQLMKHCVASYAKRAVSGQSFLFHVDHKGYMATVELNTLGNVVQARGPCNQKNAACLYGQAKLGKWAEKWREKYSEDKKDCATTANEDDFLVGVAQVGDNYGDDVPF